MGGPPSAPAHATRRAALEILGHERADRPRAKRLSAGLRDLIVAPAPDGGGGGLLNWSSWRFAFTWSGGLAAASASAGRTPAGDRFRAGRGDAGVLHRVDECPHLRLASQIRRVCIGKRPPWIRPDAPAPEALQLRVGPDRCARQTVWSRSAASAVAICALARAACACAFKPCSSAATSPRSRATSAAGATSATAHAKAGGGR